MVEYSYPGRRIAYDVDGTKGFLLNSERLTPDLKGTLSQLSSIAMSGMNGDIAGGLLVPGRVFSGSGAFFVTTPGIWGEATYPGQRNFVVLFFPDPMHIRGWFANLAIVWQNHLNSSSDSSGTTLAYPEFELETSHDTTNGQDGTWYSMDYKDANTYFPSLNTTQYQAPVSWRYYNGMWWHDPSFYTHEPTPALNRSNPDLDEYQDGRETGRGWFPTYGGHARNVRAIRISTSATGPRSSIFQALVLLHLYGEPDVNAGLTRLALVDPVTGIEMTENPSWGNVDFNTGGTISVGIKNLSPTETAEGVEVSIGDSYPNGTPAYASVDLNENGVPDDTWGVFLNPLDSFLELSLDEVTWTPTLSLGDLAPEETVEVFARLLPPINAPLPPPYINPPDPAAIGLRFARFTFETEGWV